MRILGTVASSSREVPNAPTIGTATNVGSGRAYNNGRADVTFTAPTFNGGLPITSYTVTSSPGGFTGTGAASPISVTGLQSATAYTFTVTATNGRGTGPASAASNSITATTVPQAPTITSATRSSNTVVSIAFTGATGGAALSAVTATSSPSVAITSSGTSSPMTATATYIQGTSYTFTITATNANGTSSASSASSAVTPFPVPTLGAWTASTDYPFSGASLTYSTGVGNGSLFWVGSGFRDDGESVVGSSLGYRWTGSAWSYVPYPSNTGNLGSTRVNTSGTDGAYFGGGAFFVEGDAVYRTTYSLTSPSTFTSRNGNFPVDMTGVGLAALNSSGNIRQAGGKNRQGLPTYYITSVTSGTWTSTGVASYGGSTWCTGIDNNFSGEGYYFNTSGINNQKVTSSTSAFTSIANTPWGFSESAPSASVVNGVTILFPNRVQATANRNPYSFNGSTYTAQTIFPANKISVYGGASDATTYRLASTAETSGHYFATMS